MNKFRAKLKSVPKPDIQVDFNSDELNPCKDRKLELKQQEQGAKLDIINIKRPNYARLYPEQRDRGTYITSICQPEAPFDLLVAAQI